MFLAAALEAIISPRDLHYFYWRMVLENKIWALNMLIGQQKETPKQSSWWSFQTWNFKQCLAQGSEKAMVPHSSTLAWKIPWTEEPGRLQSMGSRRVRYDWVTSLFTFMHWRRKWQPTPVFLTGESQGRGRLVGCRLWGHTESDTTEAT